MRGPPTWGPLKIHMIVRKDMSAPNSSSQDPFLVCHGPPKVTLGGGDKNSSRASYIYIYIDNIYIYIYMYVHMYVCMCICYLYIYIYIYIYNT